MLGAYGQKALSPYLVGPLQQLFGLEPENAQSTAAIVILIVLTVLAMILGELIPKSLALQSPTRVALATLLPMQWSQSAMSWFISVLNGSGTLILRAMGASLEGHRHVHSPEEIEYLVTESGKGGLLKPSELIRLQQALHLGRRSIQELMVPRTAIEAIDADDAFSDVVQRISASSYTRLPVYRETIDDIIGIVHSRDVALAAWAAKPPRSVEELMRPALVLPASMTADRVLARLKEEKRTMAVLADEFGGTAGLVTIDNFVDELIGDVTDEFRDGAPVPEVLPDGRIRLPGSFHVSEMWSWTRARWTGAVTVGGAVLAAFGRAPVAGERIVIAGVEVEVEHVVRNRIDSIIVRPLGVEPDDRSDA